jgi:hypothetical protein
MSSVARTLVRPGPNGSKSSTQPYLLKCKKIRETEDLLMLSRLAILLRDKPFNTH